MPSKVEQFNIYNYDELVFSDESHLLLGNGFGSSLLRTIFSYSALKQGLDPSAFIIGDNVQNLFDYIGSDDFEEVIKRLVNSESMAVEYGATPGDMITDSESLKKELIASITTSHPSYPLDGITDANYVNCGAFLKHFKSIYTLNYDLLLYWTVNKTGLTGKFNDGFVRAGGTRRLPLVWVGKDQNLFHLHGGLHLYKIHWETTEQEEIETLKELLDYDYIKLDNVSQTNHLIDQIRNMIQKKIYPITVAEGDSVSKKHKIMNEKILRHAFFNFSALSGTLYTFGAGLDKDQDNHLIEAMTDSNLNDIVVGVYKPTIDVLLNIEKKIRSINHQRSIKAKSNIDLYFYDTSTFSIWT